MRILIISRYPPFPGGRENFVLELANSLALDNDVYVLTPDTQLNHKGNPSVLKYPESDVELEKIIEDFKPDIINSHTFYLSDKALKISRKKNIPFGITLHGDQFAIGDKQRQNIVVEISKEADFVINVSANGKESIVKNVSNIDVNKIFVIHNGVNLNKFKNQQKDKSNFKKQFGLDAGKFIVLTPTRIASYKGIDFLIDTINLGKNFYTKNNFLFLISIPDYEFSNDEKKQFDEINEKIKSLALNDLIKFIFVRYDAVHKIYNVADVFVLPSEKEQFPMSILEAMASGVPVVATKVGGIPELLSSGIDSMLVEFGDVVALYKAIELFFVNPDPMIRDVARNRVETMFSIDEVAKKYTEVFQKYFK